MAERMIDVAVAKIKLAIEGLQVPAEVKDRIEWEVIPAMTPSGLGYVPMICVKVPNSADDYVLHAARPPGLDAHDQQHVFDDAIRQLVSSACQESDERGLSIIIPHNGHGKRSPGGLALP
jgi:hypothetical protein